MFHLISPILKSLNKDSNTHVHKGFTRRVLPWTGHHRGGQVRSFVQNEDIQGALDTLQNNRVRFNPRGLGASKQNQEVYKIFKENQRTLPLIDTLLTERLCGTTAVTTSLIGALFSEIKSALQIDFV